MNKGTVNKIDNFPYFAVSLLITENFLSKFYLNEMQIQSFSNVRRFNKLRPSIMSLNIFFGKLNDEAWPEVISIAT